MSLRGFPRRTLRGDTTLLRIHLATRGAWWFSGDGSGRFDPTGTGLGACYLAERPLGAWIEVFRKRMLIAESEIVERALCAIRLGREVRLADLTSRRALSFGVTASLGANEVYTASQAFATRAVEVGFDGIRYLVRHDPAQDLRGVALFGEIGSPDPNDDDWPAGIEGEIEESLIEEAVMTFGYRVLPTP